MRSLNVTIMLDKEGTITSGVYPLVQWKGNDYFIWARRGDVRILLPYNKADVKSGAKGQRPYLSVVVPRIGELVIDKQDLYAHLLPEAAGLLDLL